MAAIFQVQDKKISYCGGLVWNNIETIAAIIGTAAPVAALILGLSWERKAARILRERHAAKIAQRATITGANWERNFSNRATSNNASK